MSQSKLDRMTAFKELRKRMELWPGERKLINPEEIKVQLDLFKDKPENAQDTDMKDTKGGKRWG